MSFTFRPAARENVGLLVGLSGGTGSGKTFTAMRLANGIAGDEPFCVIDTEAGRAKHYADRFRFDHGDLAPPFTPDRYAEAIAAADAAKYPVIVVDSASHEHAGEGGLLDWHEKELNRMAGDDWKKREACNMAAWVKPKMSHKQMVQKLLQVRAHLILCFRAEPKVEMVKDAHGKWEVVEKKTLTGLHGWVPICEKTLPYEMTASFLLMADRPGVPLPIKLQEQHRSFFPKDQPITEQAGQQLAAWARGGAPAERDRVLGTEATPPSELDARSPAVVDWSARIAAAGSPSALTAVGRALVNAAVSPEQREVLRTQYGARQQELAGRGRSKPPTAGEIFK